MAKYIRADQELTDPMRAEIWRAELKESTDTATWEAIRDAAPTVEAVPVEALRELADDLIRAGQEPSEVGIANEKCGFRIRALIAQHTEPTDQPKGD